MACLSRVVGEPIVGPFNIFDALLTRWMTPTMQYRSTRCWSHRSARGFQHSTDNTDNGQNIAKHAGWPCSTTNLKGRPPFMRRTCTKSLSDEKAPKTGIDSFRDKEVPVEECLVPSAADLKKFLRKQRYEVEEGFVCLHFKCPFCSLVHTRDSGRVAGTDLFYVNKVSGHSICRCNIVQGTWHSMKDSLSAAKKRRNQAALDTVEESKQKSGHARVLETGSLWEEAVCLSTVGEKLLGEVQKKFGVDGISVQTFKFFNVRLHRKMSSLIFPHYGFDQRLSGYNRLVRKVSYVVTTDTTELEENAKPPREKTITMKKESHPRGGTCGLFGLHQHDLSDDQLVLTISEMDAMAVHEALKVSVLALPNSTARLPQEVLPLLERFKKIILWFGNDIRSWEAAKQFSKKLNSSRCFLIRPLDKHPGPLEALQKGLKLGSILKEATAISHKAIITFNSLREEVRSELTHAEQVAGVKWQRYPHLTKFLKGHRRGELTIFTGPTGSGKTTFMSEYSLDLCNQGVNTLWGSFEIKNVRLAKIMLTQFAQMNLEKNINKFDRFANQFEQLPLFFMAFHGSQTLQRVLEAMHHAVYVHDIQHVILDNLQFMVGLGSRQNYSDRFSMYDNCIASFREFATTNSCHVTVVIHPRKERETEELLTSSIFGSAKASQEADNVLILQDRRLIDPIRGKKFIQVAKNRFDGDLGIFQLHFDKNTLMMSPPKQRQARKKKPEEAVSPDTIDKEGGDKYEIFEKLMLQSKSEEELGVGE